LHQGSLLAALASFLDARHAGGEWLLRIEDIDPPREQPGAAGAIIDCLQAHGLEHDGPILWQHTRGHAYAQALAVLSARGSLFRCGCSRRQLGADGSCIAGCAHLQIAAQRPHALRLRLGRDAAATLEDRFSGPQRALPPLPADVVVRRRDGWYAYHLAVVVDDAAQGVTDVVRGADLLPLTPIHCRLQQLLGLPTPRYAHCPLLLDERGVKLSKQTGASALDPEHAVQNLRRALQHLGQTAPPQSARTVTSILRHAIDAWQPVGTRGVRQAPQSAD
jgi:glutamyl-Q tRNA(Asp) synthetase